MVNNGFGIIYTCVMFELDSGLSSPGTSPGQGHCVVLLSKTLCPHSASLHPGVKMGTGELNAWGNLRWTSILSKGKEKYF